MNFFTQNAVRSALEQEKADIFQMFICPICCAQPVSCTLQPGGYLVCSACADQLARNPITRDPITDRAAFHLPLDIPADALE